MSIIIELLCCRPESNIMLYVNYISNKNKKTFTHKNKGKQNKTIWRKWSYVAFSSGIGYLGSLNILITESKMYQFKKH